MERRNDLNNHQNSTLKYKTKASESHSNSLYILITILHSDYVLLTFTI